MGRVVGQPLVVQVLGVCRIRGGDRETSFPILGFPLVALLAHAGESGVSRAQVAGLIWPELRTTQARANLRQTLSRINRAAGEALIAGEAVLRLARPDRVDLGLLIMELDRGAAGDERVLDLCHGAPLADQTSLPGPLAQRLSEDWALVVPRVLAAGDRRLERAVPTAELRARVERLRRMAGDRSGTQDGAVAVTADTGSRLAERPALTARPKPPRTVPAQAAAQAPPPERVGAMPAARPRLAFLLPDGEGAAHATLARQVVMELAYGLTAWRSFAVLAPHSSFAVAPEFGLPRDNAVLRAEYCVAGQFDAPGQLRLGLTHVASRTILWASVVPLGTPDLGASLRRLTARIVSTLAAAIERHLREDRRATTPADALLHYLDGRAIQARCDLPSVRRARSRFARALMIDPDFAPAEARIAETLFVEWILCGGTDAELLSTAKERADRAVRSEPGGATGHWVSGAVALYQRRWDRVEEAFSEAESLSPHDADMLLEYGDALSHLGAHAEAEGKFAAALDLNPLPPDRYWWFGASIAFNGLDFATAAARCDRIADKGVALGLRTASYAQSGQMDLARRWARRLREALPGIEAEDLVRLSPDRDGEANNKAYVEGLRMAGVK